MAARAWMRERALDTDSHHECIGSVTGFFGSVVLGVGMDEDGDDESLRWNSMLLTLTHSFASLSTKQLPHQNPSISLFNTLFLFQDILYDFKNGI